jgi:uncharacterized protein (DUF2267 family)
MTFEQMLERVRYEGAHPTREEAEKVVCAVLTAFGHQLKGAERRELTAKLPQEAAAFFSSDMPTKEPLTGWGFVKDLASHTGGTAATTRWGVGTVLGVVAKLAGEELTRRILTQLPHGYAALFGRAELTVG